jgi:molecular chaperone DnaK (HSP70)
MTRPEMSSQTRLIVGIDYGTTFSGVSFALSTVTNPNEINVWSTFPRAGQHKAETYSKAPSWVSLPEENEDGEFLWGYEVETGMTTRQWMKLMLDRKANSTKYDDPRAKDVMTGVTSPLPGDWTPFKIVTAYLRAMYCMVMKGLQKYFEKTLLDAMPMDIWLTVPAVWSDAAKLLTKKAAREAGIASRPGDTLQLIAEPEAAAHVAIREAVHKSIEVVEAGSGVLICDAGGGTVDITTYEIVSSEPQLILHEICPGAGGKCGGSFIDRNLHDLLAARFGEAYLSLPEEDRGASSNFMDAFEHAKQDVSAHDPSTRKTKLQLDMPRLRRVPGHQQKYEDYYSFKSRSVLLSHYDWKTLFDPVVDRVISLVKDQITEANEVCQIRNVVLVGGFGESNYLFDRLKDACNPHVNVRTPLCRP